VEWRNKRKSGRRRTRNEAGKVVVQIVIHEEKHEQITGNITTADVNAG